MQNKVNDLYLQINYNEKNLSLMHFQAMQGIHQLILVIYEWQGLLNFSPKCLKGPGPGEQW